MLQPSCAARLVRVLLVLALVTYATAAARGSDWTWETNDRQGELWMRASLAGAAKFDYRVGGGGAIAEMRDLARHSRRLLSPSYAGEETDRVLQFTAWSETVRNPVHGLPAFEHRFNVTQAGAQDGDFSPTTSVDLSGNRLDIYAVPQDQWKSAQQGALEGKLSTLTRYEMRDDGALAIRRVIHVGDATVQNRVETFDHLYIESWSPFDRSYSTFDSLALGIDSHGVPDWWYRAGHNLPHYPHWNVEDTNGYAVVFSERNRERSTAVGLVYGVNQVVSSTPDDVFELNSMQWNNGIGVLPALTLFDVAPGTIVDQTVFLLPHHALDEWYAWELASLAQDVPAPRIYAPGEEFDAELAQIVDELTNQLGQTGARTQLLATLLSPEDVGSLGPVDFTTVVRDGLGTETFASEMRLENIPEPAALYLVGCASMCLLSRRYVGRALVSAA